MRYRCVEHRVEFPPQERNVAHAYQSQKQGRKRSLLYFFIVVIATCCLFKFCSPNGSVTLKREIPVSPSPYASPSAVVTTKENLYPLFVIQKQLEMKKKRVPYRSPVPEKSSKLERVVVNETVSNE